MIGDISRYHQGVHSEQNVWFNPFLLRPGCAICGRMPEDIHQIIPGY